jgi:hypothetical protein
MKSALNAVGFSISWDKTIIVAFQKRFTSTRREVIHTKKTHFRGIK